MRANRFGIRTAVVTTTALASLACVTQAQASEEPGVDDPTSSTHTLQESIDDVLANTEGGTQISPNEVAWEGGAVVMSFPDQGEQEAPASSAAVQTFRAKATGQMVPFVEVPLGSNEGCPTEKFGNDWYCFYQYDNYGGRRLQWNAAHTSKMYFSNYDFINKTSSWVNGGGKTIYVYGRTRTGDDSSCTWTESKHFKDNDNPHDNQADCFKTS